jgi:flavin reductase (DIM6/NTAB) family NADH-FMN oxidoreductase RutF
MIEIESLPTDPRTLRQAYGCFPSGVTAVCALADGVPVGMAASSFTSVSMDPPLVSVCVQDSSTTWPKLRGLPRLGLSVLAEGHDAACTSLSSKHGDRFAGVDWEATADDAVFVHGSTVWLDCSVDREVPAGDHAIVLLRIHGLQARPDTAPLVFHGSRFRTLAAV